MRDLHYLTDHYDEKISQINALDAPLNFVFITDEHSRLNHGGTAREPDSTRPYELAVDHVASIQYILDRCPGISMVVNGGDIGNDYDPDPAGVRTAHREIMDAFYSLSVPVHCCVGNHDDAITISTMHGRNNVPFAILPEEMHRLCMKNNPTKENYYYLDLPGQNYRFVFMNTTDRPYYLDERGQYTLEPMLAVSDRQAEWLENEALASDRKIIVFSHAPLSNEGIFGTIGPKIYMKPYDDTLNAPRVNWAIKQCKNVVATIHGHVHYDNLVYRDRIVTVTSLCSLVQVWAPSSPARKFGDITETAFDVFSIKDNLMYITRFGAGHDRIATLLR